MSFNSQYLVGDIIKPASKTGLSSSLSNIFLDLDDGQSSIVLCTGSSPSLYVDKFGNTGINTVKPTTQLEVASMNGACLRLRYGNALESPFADVFMTSNGNLKIDTSTVGSKITTSSSVDLTNHDGSNIGLKLAGVLVEASASQLNYTKVIAGAASASRALVLDSLLNITGINSLSSNLLSGTIMTPSQPNITSIGILSNLTVLNDITAYSLEMSGDTIRTSYSTLNISAKSLSSTGNIFINGASKQYGFNTQTLQSGYQMTISGSTSNSGLYITGTNTMMCLKNISTTGSGRTLIQFLSDQNEPIEIGQRNSGDLKNPNGFYIFSTRYLMSLTTRGMLSIPNAYETGLNIGDTSTGLTSEHKIVVCDSNMLSNTRQGIFLGHSLATNNACHFSYYHTGNGSASNRIGIGFTGANDILTVLSSGKIGISNSSPQVPLQVSGFVSLAVGSTGQQYGYGTASAGFAQGVGIQTLNIGMKVDYGVHIGSVGVYVTSDRRMKSNIKSIDKDAALHFIMNTEPRTYDLKEDNNKQIGYIAQELRSSIFGDLVSFGFKRNNFPAESPDDIENVILVAQYERICCILHKGLQDALKRISALEAQNTKAQSKKTQSEDEHELKSFRYF